MSVQQGGPGWYPDAEVPGGLRWWTGETWSEHRAVNATLAAPPKPPPDRYDVPYGEPKVGFGQAVGLAFRQYARFSGRSSRSEYWWFYLFCWLVSIATQIPAASVRASQTQGDSVSGWALLQFAWWLVVLLPAIAVAVRRLHDTGRSGAWLFIGLVPLVGAIVLLVFFVQPGERVPNRYGGPPAKGDID